ncbi:NAD(P)-dependent oxidoreductase [Sporolactobacillus terrae]|uniref:NAD(P)-dependent oxidoreductase n=1 Tax=Sporolactobacillus terrae TaxID=269673 RepID=UPI000491A245|nr:NAD(P)-dependent oxidoreductase [Sporolactobacillus terrae]
MDILLLTELKDEQRKMIQLLPDITIYDRNTITHEKYASIQVILGWNTIANQILAGPNCVGFIQTVSAGVDALPLKQLAFEKVLVANTSGIHAESLTESTIGMILAFTRGLFPMGPKPFREWKPDAKRKQMGNISDQTVLIFGTGHIGSHLASRLKQFDAKVLGISRHGETKEEFDRVGCMNQVSAFVKQADIIVNVLPLTRETYHYFDNEFFSLTEQQPLFVNVGRGESVDQVELIRALKSGRISGAALDVVDPEPLPNDDPLWKLPNVLITPHIAGSVPHFRDSLFNIFYPNLKQYVLHGSIVKNQVDLTRGY